VGNKWLGNACVGLSFKALFALEIEDGGTYVMVGFGGILCLLHKFSPFSSIFFFLPLEGVRIRGDGACRKDKDWKEYFWSLMILFLTLFFRGKRKETQPRVFFFFLHIISRERGRSRQRERERERQRESTHN
jgi:hypothetical protein